MARLKFEPRPILHLAGISVLLAYLLLMSGSARLRFHILMADLAEPVTVRLRGPSPSEADRVAVSALFTDGHQHELVRRADELTWEERRFWIKKLRLSASLDVLARIGGIHVTVGRKQCDYGAAEFLHWPSPPVAVNRESSPLTPDPLVSLEFPGCQAFSPELGSINWPAWTPLAMVMKSLFLLPLIGLVILALRRAARSASASDWLGRALTGEQNPDPGGFGNWRLCGLVMVAGALLLLEFRQPFYFTQDDNYSQFLPVIVDACRAVFSGHWPLWNPHQLMGSPTGTVGTYALTYPFTYLAFGVARLMGNEYLTIEVFAVMHMAAGYLVTFAMLRGCRLRAVLCATGAFTFVLSGYFLVAGRSWYYMLPVMVWAPCLVIAVNRLLRAEPGWRWAAGTGLAIGLFFHAGNAQMWVYALLFFGLSVGILLLAGEIPAPRVLWCVPALLIGVGIAAPLLVLQVEQTAQVHRGGGLGYGVTAAAPQMLLPLGHMIPDPEDPAGQYRSDRAEIYYAGTIFTAVTWAGIAALFGLLMGCRARKAQTRLVVGRNVWLICAAVALLLGLGSAGLLWDMMAKLPMFDKFNVPKKFLAYINLFSIIGGGMILERVMRSRRRAEMWISGVVCVLMLVHLHAARESFCNFGALPYPAASAEIAAKVTDANRGRLQVIAPLRSRMPGYTRTMALNLATVAGAYAFSGYDPLVENSPENDAAFAKMRDDPIGAAQAYGVRWVLVSPLIYTEAAWSPDGSLQQINPREVRSVSMFRKDADSVLESRAGALYHLRNADPMAFRAAIPQQALPVRFDSTGVRVDVSTVPAGETLVVNVLWRPWLKAQNAALHADRWGRVELTLPRPMKTLDIEYLPPWKRAVAGSLIVLVFGILSGLAVPAGQRQMARAMARIFERRPLAESRVGSISHL